MRSMVFAEALLPEGWRRDVRVEVDADGRIATVTPDAAPGRLVALPGMPDLHSHAFQRGMAGLTEHAGASDDSFWTWRELMYRFLAHLTPEDVEAIATLAYAEMLEGGFTRVGEFHYLHHAPDGTPHADRAEMAVRIAAAAQASTSPCCRPSMPMARSAAHRPCRASAASSMTSTASRRWWRAAAAPSPACPAPISALRRIPCAPRRSRRSVPSPPWRGAANRCTSMPPSR